MFAQPEANPLALLSSPLLWPAWAGSRRPRRDEAGRGGARQRTDAMYAPLLFIMMQYCVKALAGPSSSVITGLASSQGALSTTITQSVAPFSTPLLHAISSTEAFHHQRLPRRDTPHAAPPGERAAGSPDTGLPSASDINGAGAAGRTSHRDHNELCTHANQPGRIAAHYSGEQ